MKNKNEIARIKTLLESDRVSVGDNFSFLIKSDIVRILSEYFDFVDEPEISIAKGSGKFNVNISFNVNKIKTFGIVPKY